MARVSFPYNDNRQVMQNVSPVSATLATTYDSSISASTEITLNAATSFLEVSAIDKAVLMKWGTADVTTSNFDAVIPANTVRYFYIPSATTAVNFIEQAASAALCVVEK